METYGKRGGVGNLRETYGKLTGNLRENGGGGGKNLRETYGKTEGVWKLTENLRETYGKLKRRAGRGRNSVLAAV